MNDGGGGFTQKKVRLKSGTETKMRYERIKARECYSCWSEHLIMHRLLLFQNA